MSILVALTMNTTQAMEPSGSSSRAADTPVTPVPTSLLETISQRLDGLDNRIDAALRWITNMPATESQATRLQPGMTQANIPSEYLGDEPNSALYDFDRLVSNLEYITLAHQLDVARRQHPGLKLFDLPEFQTLPKPTAPKPPILIEPVIIPEEIPSQTGPEPIFMPLTEKELLEINPFLQPEKSTATQKKIEKWRKEGEKLYSELLPRRVLTPEYPAYGAFYPYSATKKRSAPAYREPTNSNNE